MIFIHKNDSTVFADQDKFLTFHIKTDLDLTGWKAEFVLCSVKKIIENISTKTFDVILSSKDTSRLYYGNPCGELRLIDKKGNIKTIANNIPFCVTNEIVENESQVIDLDIPESAEIQISVSYQAPAAGGTTNYEELENKPLINGVELTGDKSLDELGIQPKGDYLKAGDIPQVDLSEYVTKDELNTKQDTLTAGANITIKNNVISAQGGGSGMPISAIYKSNCSDKYVPDESLPCDGLEYNKVQYTDLWDNYLNQGLLNTCSYAEYQQEIEKDGQCGKFAIAKKREITSNNFNTTIIDYMDYSNSLEEKEDEFLTLAQALGLKQFVCNDTTTWYLTNTGELYGCGNNGSGQQGGSANVITFTKVADNVKKVACSISTTWYITNNSELYGTGQNNRGQQGAGSTSDVRSFTKRADNVKDVVCSQYVTWYVTNDSELYGCGYNTNGQQGDGTTINVTSFTKRADNVAKVYCSSYTTWYITNNGELFGCGTGYAQGSGNSTNVSTFTKRAENVKDVSCSQNVTWYITNNNELYGCGKSAQGSGNTNAVYYFTKRAENVKKVQGNDSTTFYLTNNNELFGCGSANYGQQGNGNTITVTTFTKLADNVKDFSASTNTTWYVTNNNELYGTGYNNYGQQGDGTTTNVTTFTLKETNVKEVYCSDSLTWYITNNGALFGCGYNAYGQQGAGNTTNVTTFVERFASSILVLTEDGQTKSLSDYEISLEGNYQVGDTLTINWDNGSFRTPTINDSVIGLKYFIVVAN